jgi:dipeptidyl aminopeptidase/acylaminoacyl peptidase
MIRNASKTQTSDPVAGCLLRLLVLPTLLLVTGCALVAPPGFAQAKPQISIEDVLDRGRPELRRAGWLGPDRLYGQFRSASGETSLRVLRADGAEGEDLAAGIGLDQTDPAGFRTILLSPDGTRLISYTGEEWRVTNRETGAQQALAAPALPAHLPDAFAWSSADWAEDAGRVAISEMYDNRTRQRAAAAPEIVNGVRLEETAPVSEPVLVYHTRLLVADLADAGDVQSWLFPGCTSAGHAFSPGAELYVTLSCFEAEIAHTKLLRIDLETEAVSEIFRANAVLQDSHPRLSPDGERIAFALNSDGSNWGAFMDLAILDADTGEVLHMLRPASKQGLAPFSEYFWSADGKAVYAGARAAGLDEIWALSLSGSHRRLAGGERKRYEMSLSPDRSKLIYKTLDGYGYSDVRTLNVSSGAESIYHVINDPQADFQLGRWTQIEWKSDSGINPKGWLVTPYGFDPKRQYPLYVYVHGNGLGSDLYLDGPFTGHVVGGPLEWHAIAALGYVVFVPDYRMSGNYGPEPIKQISAQLRDAAEFDARDVVAGVKHVVSLGFVDPQRIAIMGHSAGGTRTFKVLTEAPDLFAAAILNDSSPLDPQSILEAASTGTRTGTDFNRFMRTLLGTELADNPDAYKTNYTLDAVKIRAPTLFLRGGYGGGASPTQYASHELAFTLIRQSGVAAKYITFLDEGHTYSTPESARLAFQLVTDWMREHMPAAWTDLAPGDRLPK